jgi:aryl-alcohol dehydrogenase-like predicted oxidoreductase
MYPVPPAKETQGRTDRYIGSWLKTGRVARGDIVLATKVGGKGGWGGVLAEDGARGARGHRAGHQGGGC